MKNSLMKKVRNVTKNTFAVSFIVGSISLLATIVIAVYSFFTHLDSFITTSPNYMPFEEAAPVLHNLTLGCLLCSIVCMAVCALTVYIYRVATKKHR